MLTGATIEVSSTPLPRAMPVPAGAAAGGGGGGAAAEAGVPSRGVSAGADGTMRVSSWAEQQQKFAAAAAEKKEQPALYQDEQQQHHQQQPPLTWGCKNSICWGADSRTVPAETTAAAAAPVTVAASAAAERSWRASYASSLYCLLPAWLLRFRGQPRYSALRDEAATASAPAASSSACCSGNSLSSGARGGVRAAGGGGRGSCAAGGGADAACFGDAPFSTVCLHCHKAVITTVAYKVSCLGILLCVLSPLLLGWPGLCLSPFLWIALKDAVHTCPQCRNLLHRQSRVSVPFCGLRDEVVTVKCGSCAVVLSRRYLLLFGALLLLIVLFYVLRAGWLGNSLDIIPRGPPSDATWKQFYAQCGQRSQLGNSLKADASFRNGFAGKTVKWKGLVKQVKEGMLSSNVLFLVMTPTITGTLSGGGGGRGQGSSSAERGGEEGGGDATSEGGSSSSSGSSSNRKEEEKGEGDATSRGEKKRESSADENRTGAAGGGGMETENSTEESSSSESADAAGDEEDLEEESKALQGDGADLALAFSGRELVEKIEKLEPGDKVQFETTLVSLGRRGKPSLGRLWDVSLIEKRQAREARLQEVRAKKEEQQHLLQRLLLPIVGSPFSDFGGLDPFGSIFGSIGSMGGRGVMVVRRQIISPVSSFSIVSSSSSSLEDSSSSASSLFGAGRLMSLGGSIRDREDEDETSEKHSGSRHAAEAEEADLASIHHPRGVEQEEETVGHRFRPELISGGGSMMLHLQDEEEEENEGDLKDALAEKSRFGHQSEKHSGGLHRVHHPWGRSEDEEEDDLRPWKNASAHARSRQGVYHLSNDDDDDDLQLHGLSAVALGAPQGTGAAAIADDEGKMQSQPPFHRKNGKAATAAESEEDDNLTLTALKAAVELQRRKRSQKDIAGQQQQSPKAPHSQPQMQQQQHLPYLGQQPGTQQMPHEKKGEREEEKLRESVATDLLTESLEAEILPPHKPLIEKDGGVTYDTRADSAAPGAEAKRVPGGSEYGISNEQQQQKQQQTSYVPDPTAAAVEGVTAYDDGEQGRVQRPSLDSKPSAAAAAPSPSSRGQR